MENKNNKLPNAYSLSAYRVLYILLLFYKYKSLSVDQLNKKLLENPQIKQAYSGDTLLKYIKTIRKAGYEILRPNYKNQSVYSLKRKAFPVSFSEEELQSLEASLNLLKGLSNNKLYLSYHSLLTQIISPFEDLSEIQELLLQRGTSLEEEVLERNKILQKYNHLCNESQLLKLTYINDKGIESTLKIEPNYLLDRDSIFYIVGVEIETQKNCCIELNKILEVCQFPIRNRAKLQSTKIRFKLLGRRAKTYSLFFNDRIISDENETLIIETENTEEAFERLLKYGEDCIVLSPHTFQEKMRKHIKSFLDLYGLDESV